jgi:hypothetical protein
VLSHAIPTARCVTNPVRRVCHPRLGLIGHVEHLADSHAICYRSWTFMNQPWTIHIISYHFISFHYASLHYTSYTNIICILYNYIHNCVRVYDVYVCMSMCAHAQVAEFQMLSYFSHWMSLVSCECLRYIVSQSIQKLSICLEGFRIQWRFRHHLVPSPCEPGRSASGHALWCAPLWRALDLIAPVLPRVGDRLVTGWWCHKPRISPTELLTLSSRRKLFKTTHCNTI